MPSGPESLSFPSDAAAPSTEPLAPGLYIVATPIGNAEDIGLRALRVLRGVDVVACEDTRVTARLAGRHGIATPRTAYHEHNAERVRPILMKRLENGASVALVSDAGTPLVNDPGFRLVGDCIAAGVAVTAIPGPSAPLAALVLSGLPSDRFLFAGYPPARAAARRAWLGELAAVPATLLILESARRLPASLADMSAVLGARAAAVTRELTKLFEEVRRAPLDALAAHYAEAGPPKGEIVVVVGPPTGTDATDEVDLDTLLAAELAAGATPRDAVQAVARATGRPRRMVYARALAITDSKPQ